MQRKCRGNENCPLKFISYLIYLYHLWYICPISRLIRPLQHLAAVSFKDPRLAFNALYYIKYLTIIFCEVKPNPPSTTYNQRERSLSLNAYATHKLPTHTLSAGAATNPNKPRRFSLTGPILLRSKVNSPFWYKTTIYKYKRIHAIPYVICPANRCHYYIYKGEKGGSYFVKWVLCEVKTAAK